MATRAYVDLMFAWGHARLGNITAARQLLAAATEELKPCTQPGSPRLEVDLAHSWLLDAFKFRIERACQGLPQKFPLPDQLVARMDDLDQGDRTCQVSRRYVVYRMRQMSHILEPEFQINPWAPWMRRHPSESEFGQQVRASGSTERESVRREDLNTHADPESLRIAFDELRDADNPVGQIRAACACIRLAAMMQWSETVSSLQQIWLYLRRVPSSFTTRQYFSLLHLELTECVVIAIATSKLNPLTPLHAIGDSELASRREAIAEMQAAILTWGQPDWD